MAPLPKRKHSTARKGKRLVERQAEKFFQALVVCSSCGKRKLPHQQCAFCQSTDNTAANAALSPAQVNQVVTE